MEELDIKDLTNGYQERIRRLALFDPLYELERKREQDLLERPLDMKGLGLLTLLFFFEQKLMRKSRTGVKQLSLFLRTMTEQQYQLEEEAFEQLARGIIQTFRPTHGKKRSYPYYDWEIKEERSIEYSILKADSFDAKTNSQFYTLDEDGLELLFATKEFYSEFQLSINQLILRKQLEKGEFKGALRQINEMRIDVETLQERMLKLKHEIQRSIVSEETFERYKQLLEDIYDRLDREDVEFKELRKFVKETKERLFSKDVHLKEKQTYSIILKINQELEQVHYEHSHLLNQTFTLKETTLVSAQESLYYTGMQSFNFDQDILSQIVSKPLPLEAMKGVLNPFLKVEENRYWSPLTIFAEQNIIEERMIGHEQRFLDVDDSYQGSPYRTWLREKYKEVMELFLEANDTEERTTLTSFIEFLQSTGRNHILQQRYFYEFWLILHQRSPVHRKQDDKSLLGEALALLGGRTILVKEDNAIIHKVDRYSIQEMIIELEGDEHELF